MRRAAGLALVAALFLTSTAHGAGGPGEWRTGDANCNERIDAVDASLDLQWDARLVEALACFRAADANNDQAVDSLDAVLVLQQEAALIDRLGVAETLLCPAPAGKGRYGNIDEEIDMTGDGTPEVVSVHLFPEEDEAKLGLAVRTSEGVLQTVLEIVVPTFFFDPNGPDTWWAHTDLTGDGNDEAVLCVTAFGANDPFTSAVIYSYHGGVVSTPLTVVQAPWAQLSTEGDAVVVSSRVDWLAGACELISTQYYEWDGMSLPLTNEDITTRYRVPGCSGGSPFY
jgi:hypothetical protein